MLKPISPDAYKLLHEGTLALADVEANGMRIDRKYLAEVTASIDEKIRASTSKLRKSEVYKLWRREFGQKTNLNAGQQLAHVLYNKMGHECITYTKTGKPSTDEEALQDIDDPFVKRYVKRSKLQKLRGTYLAGIHRELNGDRVHVNFNLNVARTYRSSASDFNMQNLPIRDPFMGEIIRKCFIPDDDHVIIEMDYGGIEVCVAACYHKDPTMITYIKDPTKDMHRDCAAEIFMCKPEEVGKMERYAAKNMFVFPEFYGSYYLQCAPNLWTAMSRLNLNVKGEPMGEWMKAHGIRHLGNTNPKVETDNGGPRPGTFTHHIKKMEAYFWNKQFDVYAAWKKRWYNDYLKEGGFNFYTGFRAMGVFSRNDVINYPVQGAAFHCLLWAMTKLNARLRKYKMKSKIIGQIHDSILASVHKKEIKQYTEMAKEIMLEEIKDTMRWLIVPLKVEAEACEVGESWFEKKALAI